MSTGHTVSFYSEFGNDQHAFSKILPNVRFSRVVNDALSFYKEFVEKGVQGIVREYIPEFEEKYSIALRTGFIETPLDEFYAKMATNHDPITALCYMARLFVSIIKRLNEKQKKYIPGPTDPVRLLTVVPNSLVDRVKEFAHELGVEVWDSREDTTYIYVNKDMPKKTVKDLLDKINGL